MKNITTQKQLDSHEMTSLPIAFEEFEFAVPMDKYHDRDYIWQGLVIVLAVAFALMFLCGFIPRT